tara:strand:- start:9367 stop:9735 length:369 start_codon:yes stop_codon:yes gene_type:complete
MGDKIILDFEAWKVKQIKRSNGRMKIQIKLGKEEALAFKNFIEMVKPPEVAEDDFIRGIFRIGVETMEQRLMDAVEKHAAENNIDLTEMREQASAEEKEEVIVPVVGEVSELNLSKEKTDEA